MAAGTSQQVIILLLVYAGAKYQLTYLLDTTLLEHEVNGKGFISHCVEQDDHLIALVAHDTPFAPGGMDDTAAEYNLITADLHGGN